MKSFKEYLVESQQTYDFKVKLAGDTFDNAVDTIKKSLTKFKPKYVNKGLSTPIQETHTDFPTHKNVSVTVYEVCLEYPATSEQVRAQVAEELGLSHACVVVRNQGEEYEQELNHEHDEVDSKPLLGQEYEKENFQDLVGEKQKMALLKELNKVKHQGEQYRGVNDEILAKKSPSEKSASASKDKINNSSPIGGRKIDLPKAKTYGGL